MVMYRVCIDCRFIFGCIAEGKTMRCAECGARQGCSYGNTEDKEHADRMEFTGGLCVVCFERAMQRRRR